MANPTWADVIAIAPGDAVAFTALPTASQDAFLNYAIGQLDPDNWGGFLFQATCYLAAHYAKLGLSRGAGPVTQEAVGQMSRSYAPMKGTGESIAYAAFEQTSYGLQYLELLSSTVAALGLVP